MLTNSLTEFLENSPLSCGYFVDLTKGKAWTTHTAAAAAQRD